MKNYIGNNNEINKKKYKKSLPPKLNPDAGNVEHNIDMFNKISSGDANLSSAAGMNGMAESYDRDSLIARIIEFGKHYNFDKYTDAQLNAMLNRLVDAENYRKRVLPKHQDRIDIKSERHIMNDDPSYNFDDPEREGEYRVENLREALNKLDHYCIDNDKKFHDLRSLYENIQHQLTPQEKQELKKLVDTTNDPDAVKAYLDSKDPDRKNEDLKEKYISEEDAITEALDQVKDKSSENLIAFIESNHPEIVPVDMDSYLEWYNKVDAKIKPLLESNDNLTYDELVALAKEHYKEGGMEIIEFWDENSLKEYEKEFGPMTKKQAIRLMKVMGNVSKDEEEAGEYFAKQTFDEGLNRKELETFSRAIFNAGDKAEALEIIDQIYQYDKDLSLQLKDMWDESASDAYNTDKLSGYLLRYLDESLNEDTVKQGNKWVNKGKEGTHGKFNTKKQADAQRKAMYANGYKGESLEEKLEKGTKVKLNKAAWHKDQSKVGTVKGNIGETYWIEWPDGEVTQEIKGYLDIVNEDIDSTLAARERRDRIEYLKNQIKEETKDWQTKFGDKGSVDIFKENDKKIKYAISPFIRHDNGESLDVIEKTFKEIIRKTNKYFNLEGTEKFRLKLNPMFVTIICP